MNGLLTEREWRKQYTRRKSQPDWYGPQYVLKIKRQSAIQKDRSFHIFLFLLSVVIACLLPVFVPAPDDFSPSAAAVESISGIEPRKVSAIRYVKPSELEWAEHTYTSEQLARGRLLLLDQTHRLPTQLPPPNTFSIAAYGKGMVPIADLGIQSGRETIDALKALFEALEQKGINNIVVCGGTVSAAQQRDRQIKELRQRMRKLPPGQAVEQTLQETDWPDTGEMLQEYTVELRVRADMQAYDAPLEESESGQTLLQLAWRYGFIRTHAQGRGENPFRFRYVGKAHATAMTFLDLGLADYLQLLHEKECLTIHEGGQPKYVILCQKLQGTHVRFPIPINAICEASLDNTGYAVVACTL